MNQVDIVHIYLGHIHFEKFRYHMNHMWIAQLPIGVSQEDSPRMRSALESDRVYLREGLSQGYHRVIR